MQSFKFGNACELIGGLALFIYGMSLASDGLKRSAGGKMRVILGLVTRNRLAALAVGVILTVLLQSSSAMTVMLVGLANSGFLTLHQSVGIILGSDIGTTLTIQLIAFELVDYALLAVAVGVVLMLVGRRKRWRYLGRLFVGFGLVFFGMHVMKGGVEPLKHHQGVTDLLASFGEKPILGVLVATAVTAIIQSSAATVAFVLTLSSQGILDVHGAIPLILGANIGTCATAGLGAIGATREGVRVAVVHLLVKVMGVAIFLPFVGTFTSVVASVTEVTGGGAVRAAANAHTLFNVANALIFLPFTGSLARFVAGIVRARGEAPGAGTLYLEGRPGSATYVELRRIARELAHMADGARRMVGRALDALLEGGPAAADIASADEELDHLNAEVVRYASEVASGEIEVAEARELSRMVAVAKELEYVGDLVSKDLVTLAEKLAAEEATFSMAGTHELRELHSKTDEGAAAVADALGRAWPDALAEADARDRDIRELHRRIQASHFDRVAKGVGEAVKTDAVFTDAANAIRQIHGHVLEISRLLAGCEVLGRAGPPRPQEAAEADTPDGPGTDRAERSNR